MKWEPFPLSDLDPLKKSKKWEPSKMGLSTVEKTERGQKKQG